MPATGGRQRERQSSFPMIPVEDAIALVLQETQPLPPVKTKLGDVPLGAVLAQDVTAPEPHPPFPASIMDGYAVVAADGTGVLEVVGRILAGVDSEGMQVSPGKCAYITTGAKLPQGADAVVKVEDTSAVEGASDALDATETHVRILKGVQAGTSIRPVGHDVKQGEAVLAKGDKIFAAEVGLLATVGVTEVEVVASPVVGVMSTGDELVEAGEPLVGGCIRDSNRPTLLAALRALGATVKELGIIRDQSHNLREAFVRALDECDVIVTSGGVSMGEADLLKPLLKELGTLHFGRINMKPGKPTTFATVERAGRKKLIFALPGNPVSSIVTTHLFVEPAVRRLRGMPVPDCLHPQVSCSFPHAVRLDPERPEYHRAVLRWDHIAGKFVADSTGSQLSSRLLSVKGANALVCLPSAAGDLPAGAPATALLIGRLPAPKPEECFHLKAALVGTPSAEAAPAGATGPPSNYVSLRAMGGPAQQQTHGAGQQCGHDHSHGQDHGHSHDHGHGGQQGHSHSHSHAHAPHAPHQGPPPQVRTCLLTVSDRVSQGVYSDGSGPAMSESLAQQADRFAATVVETLVVPDEPAQIQAAIKRWVDELAVDMVLTSGGTGFGRRDLTPEAIKPLLHREAPGIIHAIYQGGLKFTPLAVMSRPVAGTRNNTLIVTLPGSVKAVKENIGSIAPLVPHIINLLQGNVC